MRSWEYRIPVLAKAAQTTICKKLSLIEHKASTLEGAKHTSACIVSLSSAPICVLGLANYCFISYLSLFGWLFDFAYVNKVVLS